MVLSGAVGDVAHVAPVPLANVARLALGEIEDYTRVDVQVPTEAAAAPAIVGDLVLALAELMENATVFSPPHTRVLVSGELTENGVQLTVVDHGIGMTEARLADENARLTRRERLDLAPTEVLGLFVVGRLARRHHWAVGLSATPGGGVTATLQIPRTSLVVGTPERPALRSRRAAGPTPARTGAPQKGAPAAVDLAVVSPTEPAVAPPGFNPTLLTRASESMELSESWDAFATGPEPAGKPARSRPRPIRRP